MPVKTINTEVFVNHMRDTLRNPDNKFCFVLGAGASVESGISSGAMLAKQWYSELDKYHDPKSIDEWKETVQFDEKDVPAFYSKLFRFRYDGHREDGIHFISSIIEKGNPGFGYTILSQVLKQTAHNVVVTTNFDTLTEESLFIFTDKRALVCSHENLAHLARPSSTRPLIVKIHRGLYMDPMNDQDEVADMKDQWKKALTDIFRNYIPIVIGYGGNDGSLMNYLKSIDPCQRLYWCIPAGRTPRADISEVVEKHRGTFVEIGGFNRLMFRFIDLFSLTKVHEVLEQVAKERAEKLRKEFEEASLDIGKTGTLQEKQELGKVAEEFDEKDWLQWDLKARSLVEYLDRQKIYKEALSVLPDSYQLWYNYGVEFSDYKKLDEAIIAYKKVIEIKPDFEEAWYNMGNAFFYKGEYDFAIENYRQSVKINPRKHEAWFNMGNTFIKKNEFDQALEAYKRALEIKPEKHEAWHNMGFAYDELGNYKKAISAYQKSLDLIPDYDKAWYNMGISYKKLGNKAKALNCYEKALELNPGDNDYENAIESLRKEEDRTDL